MFIVFEGIDGAGTTTQTRAVGAKLREKGYSVVETREPSDGPIGRFIREAHLGENRVCTDPGVLIRLFCADRQEHWLTVIEPAIARCEVVLCDRYSWSTFAYQGAQILQMGHSSGSFFGASELLDYCLSNVAIMMGRSNWATPGQIFYLEVPPEEGLRRKRMQTGNLDQYENEKTQQLVSMFYEKLSDTNCCNIIDGTLPVEQVTQAIMDQLRL